MEAVTAAIKTEEFDADDPRDASSDFDWEGFLGTMLDLEELVSKRAREGAFYVISRLRRAKLLDREPLLSNADDGFLVIGWHKRRIFFQIREDDYIVTTYDARLTPLAARATASIDYAITFLKKHLRPK
jgi:hypothetical protein